MKDLKAGDGSKPDSCLLQRANGLLLRLDTPKGRGVFAQVFIPKNTVIDVSPVLVLTKDEVELHTSRMCLQHYTYYWPDPAGGAQTQAIALGLGSMFNHSRLQQNVIWFRDVGAQVIVYTAHRDIQPGEELCISYGNARLWFNDADDNGDREGNEDGVEDELICSGLSAIGAVVSHEEA